MALAFDVGLPKFHLPCPPGVVNGRAAFPFINLAREMLGCKDRRRGHHQFDVGYGHARPFCLFLCILHHDDELGGALCLHVILHHISAEGDHVDGTKPSAVGVKEGHDVDGYDLCVEKVCVFKILVPDLIDDIAEEFGNATFGRLVIDKFIEVGFVGCLRMNWDDCCGVVGDGSIVERETFGTEDFLLPWSALYLAALVRMATREWVPCNWL